MQQRAGHVPEYPIVDSHVHLLDPARFGYAWTRGQPKLNRTGRADRFHQGRSPVEIDQFVLVEVDVDVPQHPDEAAWVSGIAQPEPRLKGMVAALPLEPG